MKGYDLGGEMSLSAVGIWGHEASWYTTYPVRRDGSDTVVSTWRTAMPRHICLCDTVSAKPYDAAHEVDAWRGTAERDRKYASLAECNVLPLCPLAVVPAKRAGSNPPALPPYAAFPLWATCDALVSPRRSSLADRRLRRCVKIGQRHKHPRQKWIVLAP